MAKKMPIDIKKLLDAVSAIGAERDLPVHVDIVYDATAPDALIQSIIEAFATTDENTQVDEFVMGAEPAPISIPADLCVIVAGKSKNIGDMAIYARGRGIPTVVVAQQSAGGFTTGLQQRAAASKDDAPKNLSGTTGIPAEDFVAVDLDDRTGRPLEELGMWIIRNVPEKRLAIASDFEFCRHPMAGEIAIGNAIQNGAIGIVFFMPGADMPLITLNQARMVLEVAGVYGQPLDKQRAKELLAVVAGAYGMRGIARQIARQVPGPLGVPIKAGIAFAGTLGMGYAAIDYFEEGGVMSALTENASTLYRKADTYVHSGMKAAGDFVNWAQDLVQSLAKRRRDAQTA